MLNIDYAVLSLSSVFLSVLVYLFSALPDQGDKLGDD